LGIDVKSISPSDSASQGASFMSVGDFPENPPILRKSRFLVKNRDFGPFGQFWLSQGQDGPKIANFQNRDFFQKFFHHMS
jgi:hypothetical protein